MSDGSLWNRRGVWIAILFLFAFLLSNVKLIVLEGGGEVAFFSMFFLFLIGFFFGGPTGLLWAFFFGLLKCFLDYPFDGVHIIAELWDYILGYTLVGVGGFVSSYVYSHCDRADEGGKQDKALLRGFLAAAGFRFLEGIANYLVFYYRPSKTLIGNIIEALIYCLAYLGVETLIIYLVLLLPSVREAVHYTKYVATNDYKEDLDSF